MAGRDALGPLGRPAPQQGRRAGSHPLPSSPNCQVKSTHPSQVFNQTKNCWFQAPSGETEGGRRPARKLGQGAQGRGDGEEGGAQGDCWQHGLTQVLAKAIDDFDCIFVEVPISKKQESYIN